MHVLFKRQEFVAVTNYAAENDNGISLQEGELLSVLDDTYKEWWYVESLKTKQKGWIPSMYLQDKETYLKNLQKRIEEIAANFPIGKI